MSFNVSNFINSALKTPIEKISDRVIGEVASGLQQSITSVASSTVSSLFNSGHSFESISSLASSKIDSIVSGSSNDYTGFSGKLVERATSSDIMNSRNGISSRSYDTTISPQGKISEKTYSSTNKNVDIYPTDIGKYQIQFNFMKYQRPSPFQDIKTETTYSVVFPIPAELRENYSVAYSTEDLGLVGDMMDSFSSGNVNPIGTGVAAGARALRRNAGDISVVAEQYFGIAPNPNISVAFQGPKLREHIFNWVFNPRTPEESKLLQNIIKNMKNKTLPRTEFTKNASLLSYPDMVEVKLSPIEYYTFKKCVVQSITASYVINGVPSFFKGTNLPTFISLSMSLLEIEYFLSEDESTSLLEDKFGSLNIETTPISSIDELVKKNITDII